MKIGFSAFYILTPTPVWSPDGSYKLAVYVDPSVAYFGLSHIGYAVVTLFLLLVVLIIPIILLFLYPCQCFHKCLNHFHLRLLSLHAFVDAFQGCYKDGTNGTRDCRYFVGLQLILRLFFPVIFLMIRESFLSLFSCAVVLGLYTTLVVIVEPYKITVYNKTDIPLLIVLLIAFFTAFACASLISPNYNDFSLYWLMIATSILCACAPLLYLFIWFAVHIKHIITHRTWCRKHTQEADQLLPQVENSW